MITIHRMLDYPAENAFQMLLALEDEAEIEKAVNDLYAMAFKGNQKALKVITMLSIEADEKMRN